MATVVMDTSALLRLVHPEPGHDLVCALWNRADSVVASRLADAELRAVLEAGRRTGHLSEAARDAALERWAECRDSVRVVEVTPELADTAGDLALRHGIRAGDAVVLAGALLLAPVDPVLAVWDGRLADAARSEGLRVLP
ncbi:conserved hypothetical protein [Beutenbergia cavernae DSM 12333]|uniref:Ribonuclease VapC n=1 Tax=Beutenbergia cavernae (strain ATCC BAA-8 / DSM 12333 / CCUG 43141 / JCM 11478 / NBRC 16432 / NCIMB 13614 / HKI 0122) TaxID=471853 RepID=C5C229_BEUC1|nr:type II toxin-antitoxin system VapC family toxin [Beutenbergia cavernae]ACQ81654.1 conserved hypothetical protein [Beutenbergia cavernae DSM 12333]